MSDNIGPLTTPTRTHHAEHNGSQVITATAMPEPVLDALVALVDALGAAFKTRDDEEREADAELTRRPCQVHLGQYADYCGPCRAEQLATGAACKPTQSRPAPAHVAVRALAEARAEVERVRRELQAAACDTRHPGDCGPACPGYVDESP